MNTVDSPADVAWITLYFHRDDYMGDMAAFVNALTAAKPEVRPGSGHIHVGVNAINITPDLFAEITETINGDKFNYEVS